MPYFGQFIEPDLQFKGEQLDRIVNGGLQNFGDTYKAWPFFTYHTGIR